MNLNRRNLLKIAGAAGAALGATAAGRALASTSTRGAAKDAVGVLVDTTRCVGCRGCEAACSEANSLLGPEKPGDDTVFASKRATSPTAYTVVQKGAKKSAAGEDRYEVNGFCDERARDGYDGFLDELLQSAQRADC